MKFLCSWTIEPKDRNESQRRLNALHDVGDEGIRVVGYWHNVNQLGGWAVLDADTEVALAKWMGRWSDLTFNDATVVIDNDEYRALIS